VTAHSVVICVACLTYGTLLAGVAYVLDDTNHVSVWAHIGMVASLVVVLACALCSVKEDVAIDE
jgi:hypothetical protein